jgi:hypothetical protein
MVVNIRKRRLLQGNSTTCEQINNKTKSETVSISNETLTSESSLSKEKLEKKDLIIKIS